MGETFTLMTLIVGSIIGIIVFQGIHSLISFIVQKSAGFYVMTFKYLFFSYTKAGGFHTCRFMPVCELSMGKDGDNSKESKRCVIITTAIQTIVCAGICAGILALWRSGLRGTMWRLVLGFGIWCVVSTVHWWWTVIKYLPKMDSMLFNRTKMIAQRIIAGETFDEIDIPDYRSFDCPATKPEIAQYQCYAFMKLTWQDDCGSRLAEVVKSMENSLGIMYGDPGMEYMLSLVPAYCMLLYYYSAISPNKSRAKYLYTMLKDSLKKDTDANSLRILAYYELYVRKDLEQADRYISRAAEALPEMEYTAERQYEDKLIKRLIAELESRY